MDDQQQQQPRPLLITFVSTCSLDRRYTEAVLGNARQFSDLVVVSLGSHLHDGRPEDARATAAAMVREHEADRSAVIAAVYDVHEAALKDPVGLHNLARRTGVEAVRRALPGLEYWALFLDGDEVPDGPAMARWWRGALGEAARVAPRVARKMANYWLFLRHDVVSEEIEDSPLLVHSGVFRHDAALEHPRERDGIYLWNLASPLGMGDLRVERNALSEDGLPMFWHYSWVRGGGGGDGEPDARSALKAKCANWGHSGERDWDRLIDDAFDLLERGRLPERDFVHGRRLARADPASSPAYDYGVR